MATAMRINEMARVVLRRHCQNDDSANCRIIEPSDGGGGGGGGHLKRKIPLPSIQFEYPNAPESDGSASNSDRLGRPIIYVLGRSIASKVALS